PPVRHRTRREGARRAGGRPGSFREVRARFPSRVVRAALGSGRGRREPRHVGARGERARGPALRAVARESWPLPAPVTKETSALPRRWKRADDRGRTGEADRGRPEDYDPWA